MMFEAYRISRNNYQLFHLKNNQRIWIASFNQLNTLLNYYVNCHNLTYDGLMFKGTDLDDDELQHLHDEQKEWRINITETIDGTYTDLMGESVNAEL